MKLLITLILLACSAMAAPQNAIIGTWLDSATPMVKSGSSTFLPNGTFSAEAELVINGKTLPLNVKGIWKIEGSVLFEKITESNQPQIAPVGLIPKYEIVTLTEDTLTIRSESGKEYTKKKK